MKKRLLMGTLAIVLLGIAGGVSWLFSSLPSVDGLLAVDGLGASVEIIRDMRGVPHIRAQSDDDAYFALGFAHAQDRMWQMETMRRHGAGRLSEVVGPSALPSDRFMRLLGVGRLVDLQFKRLDEPTRRVLRAYAAGVNGWLKNRPGALPPEFIALGRAPEPWRPADSLIWSKVMAIRLSGNMNVELLRARLAGRLSPERMSELWPSHSSGPHSVDNVAANASAALYDGLPLDRLAAAAPDPPGLPHGASNGWVASGKLTKSGKPLLANDPHLRFSAPILWYLATIEAPGLRLSGATAPGVPFTIIGHNNSIAWGVTSAQGDHEDLFVERLDPSDSSRYLAPDGPLPFKTRKEIIVVKGAEDVTFTVRETRHGPVISDILGNNEKSFGEGKVLALSATYLRDDDLTPQSLHHMNRAGGWDDFLAALKFHHSPQLNLLYADTAGNIGFIAPGRAPIRRQGRGGAPQPGWTGKADWTGFIPFDELPRAFNPPQNRIVNANNKSVTDDYPYLITDDWGAHYRARRILDLLDRDQALSLGAMTSFQHDNISLMARDLLALMIKLTPDSSKISKVLEMLGKWDGSMERDRAEPAIFTSWMREFNRAVYADELGDLFKSYWTLRPRFISSVLSEKRHWCDNIDTVPVENCQILLQTSLERALQSLRESLGDHMGRWRWGDIHQARFKHSLFTGFSLVGVPSDLSIATSGGDYTVNRGATRVSSEKTPFDHIHGPGYRVVYDLSDLSNSRFIIATGQSGNPLSNHYADMLEDWRDGRYLRLGGAIAKPEGVLKLIPN